MSKTDPNAERRRLVAAASDLVARSQFAKLTGQSFRKNGIYLRDLYDALGYERELSVQLYRARYERGGIAERIIEAHPNATWSGGADIRETEDPDKLTKFEKEIDKLWKRLGVWSRLKRADILASLGRYGVILIGAPGDMQTPLPHLKGEGAVLYLTPLAEDRATIFDFEPDKTNPRYALPRFYNCTIGKNAVAKVHYSRIVHVAEGTLDDDVYGKPRMRSCYNLLDDLDKVIGGGAEASWKRIEPGMQVDIDPEIDISPAEAAALENQLEEFRHGMSRFLRTQGAKINMLSASAQGFGANADAIMAQISATTGIPQRILNGSERGELASTQDRSNWGDRIMERRMGFAEPLVRELVDRLVSAGALPAPADGDYNIVWPEIDELNEGEKATVAVQWSTANASQFAVEKKLIVTAAEIREKILGLEPLPDSEQPEVPAEQAPPTAPPPPPGGEAGASPGDAPEAQPPAPPKLAAARSDADSATVTVLEAAIKTGNVRVLDALLGVEHTTLGGPGSGNFGHAGRPGEVGGSSSDGAATDSVGHGVSRKKDGDVTTYTGPGGSATVRHDYGQRGHRWDVTHVGSGGSLGTFYDEKSAHERAALRASDWNPDKPIPQFDIKNFEIGDAERGTLMERLNTPDGGYTFNVAKGEHAVSGYAVATHEDRGRVMPASELTFEKLQRFVTDNADVISQKGNHIGGWHDPETNEVWFDISTVVDTPEEAEALCLKHGQKAFRDLAGGRTVGVQESARTKIKAASHGEGNAYGGRPERRTTFARRARSSVQGDDGKGADGGGAGAGAGDVSDDGKAVAGSVALGGPGSGNFGHAGRPGEVGGSAGTGSGESSGFSAQDLKAPADASWSTTDAKVVSGTRLRNFFGKAGFKTVNDKELPYELRKSFGLKGKPPIMTQPAVDGVQAGVADAEQKVPGLTQYLKDNVKVGVVRYDSEMSGAGATTVSHKSTGEQWLLLNSNGSHMGGLRDQDDADFSVVTQAAAHLTGDEQVKQIYRGMVLHEMGHVLDNGTRGEFTHDVAMAIFGDRIESAGPHDIIHMDESRGEQLRSFSRYGYGYGENTGGAQEMAAEVFAASVLGRPMPEFFHPVRDKILRGGYKL